MLNPALINRELDGEDYENACPTIGTLKVAHFSFPNPEQHNPIVYGADGLFFATYPSRRTYLREAFRNEFDIYTNESDYQERPTLWVLVTLLWPGIHMILPVWRGGEFWKGIETDRNVADVLLQMSLRGGLSIAEWYSFISDQRIRKNDAKKLSKRKKTAKVN